nr:hypothetical protein [Mycoplasmopsis bovis]
MVYKLHYKILSRKCLTDSNTFITNLCLKLLDIYEVNSVTIIADKGMSVNTNISIFRISRNWKVQLISYRMKAGSKQFKEVCISYEKDYCK